MEKRVISNEERFRGKKTPSLKNTWFYCGVVLILLKAEHPANQLRLYPCIFIFGFETSQVHFWTINGIMKKVKCRFIGCIARYYPCPVQKRWLRATRLGSQELLALSCSARLRLRSSAGSDCVMPKGMIYTIHRIGQTLQTTTSHVSCPISWWVSFSSGVPKGTPEPGEKTCCFPSLNPGCLIGILFHGFPT